MKFSKTRVMHSDVGRYKKVDTGTANKPVKKSALMTDTRVKSGGVTSHPIQGTKHSNKIRGTRVTKS